LEVSSADWPLYITLGKWEKRSSISSLGKRNLTRPFIGKEVPRIIDPGACRDWAIGSKENWMRIIPEGKENHICSNNASRPMTIFLSMKRLIPRTEYVHPNIMENYQIYYPCLIPIYYLTT
jgi:hypothetical protein